MEIYKYLQWINFLTEWNPRIETPGHFTVWWLRLHQARTGVQISYFMVSVFLRVSLPDRQTDRDAKGMKLIRHGQDIGVPTHHVNALGIWVFLGSLRSRFLQLRSPQPWHWWKATSHVAYSAWFSCRNCF